MSLLTPPNSSHRSDKDKENKYFAAPLAGPSTRTVVFAKENSIHCLSTPPKPITIPSKHRPQATKSILKRCLENDTLMVPEATNQREITPEPSDPLVNLHYLDHPVEQIISNGSDDESLRELIEGYNVLAARLRGSVSDSTDADASWPLFQPLRKNTQAFVDAVVRDVGRALIDPLSRRTDLVEEDIPKFTLPSPQKSPTKKKSGLTAEQVKYARDLCTTCHSVIKLLSFILSMPAIFLIFEESQLSQMLTAILAIPMADDLPTPNARKTCALAIWLIQVQRLPVAVLRPAADRIAYVLRRGLDGELGKEGKKGSASDGLKAVHDLSVYLPDVFIPAFTPLLPSVLSNLLATTLALRTQACHALGGFVNGATSIPLSVVHTKIASIVASHITTIPPANGKSPTKPTEAAIVRTLRTTMACLEPMHVAQGPVWALSVIASFIVLLGSRLCSDGKVNRILSGLLSLGIRHKKSSVRALCCLVWRPVAWVYFQPPLPVDPDYEDNEEEVDKVSPEQVRSIHLKIMMSLVDLQAGISSIAAFLGDENATGEEPLRHSLQILRNMTSKSGNTCMDAVEAMRHMTTLPSSGREEVETWDPRLLVPKSLFSSYPGLLTSDFENLTKAVRPIFDQVAMHHDIHYLTNEQMSRPWVFGELLFAWKTALGHLEMFDESGVPDSFMEVWTNLLTANVGVLQEAGDDCETSHFARRAVLNLVELVQDPVLDLRPKKVLIPTANNLPPGSDDIIPSVDGSATLTNTELRLRVVQRLWTAMKITIPHHLLERAAEKLITALVESQKSLVPECARLNGYSDEDLEGPRNEWISLCMDVLTVCDLDSFKLFWGCETDTTTDISLWPWTKDFTCAIWKMSAEKWIEGEGHWEGGIVLLGLPFSDRHAWEPTGDDYSTWEDIFSYTKNKALDHGSESTSILDNIACFVSHFQTPGLHSASSTRLVDLLFSHIDVAEMRELPIQVVELASLTMRAVYPPEPRNTQVAMWMVRSLATVIEHCPPDLCLALLQTMDDGLCLWLSDECNAWSEHELNYDIIPLYQHILVRIQALSESLKNLETIENILSSVFTKKVLPSAVEAFRDYWDVTYSRIPTPEQGWSDAITLCLQAVGILSVPKSPDASTSHLAPAFELPPSSPRTPIVSSFSTPPTAIIKRETLSKLSSPQRPQKVLASFPTVPPSPLSPTRRRRTSSSSPRRTPLSAIQLGGSPSKRRRIMSEIDCDNEKENLIVDNVVSVTDRIAELQPSGKKRRHEEDEEELMVQQTPFKKLKEKMKPKSKRRRLPSSLASSNESEDERSVEATLMPGLPFPRMESTSDVPDVFIESAPSSRGKRGRCSPVDAFRPSLNPPAKERNHLKSLDGSNQAPPPRKIDLTKVHLRRSISIPESLLSAFANRKRKRDSISEDDEDLYALPSSDPLPALSLPCRSLRRAYTLPSSDSDASVHSMSSDDDPHLGQVTPHHLISPALSRRPHTGLMTSKSKLSIIKELFGDDVLGSDDSISSGSELDTPTKQFTTRQQSKVLKSTLT